MSYKTLKYNKYFQFSALVAQLLNVFLPVVIYSSTPVYAETTESTESTQIQQTTTQEVEDEVVVEEEESLDESSETTEQEVENTQEQEEDDGPETYKEDGMRCLKDSSFEDSSEDDWEEEDGVFTTKENIELGIRYVFPDNEDVTVAFTCLPDNSDDISKLSIKEISVDEFDLPEGFIPAYEYVYDITTDMDNGDFKYELTLPTSDDDAEVYYFEEEGDSPEKVEAENSDRKVTAKNLDHFTTFAIGTFSDSSFDTSKSTYEQGETVYMKATGLDNKDYYTVEVFDFDDNLVGTPFSCSKPGGNNEYIEVDNFSLAPDAPIGNDWYAVLNRYDDNKCEEDVINTDTTLFNVEEGDVDTYVTYAQCLSDYEGRISICHATSSDSKQYNLLEDLPCNAVYGKTEHSGHFNENGTPTSGHEDDVLALEGKCPGDIVPGGSITIIKDSQPDSSIDFTFSGDLGEFKLDDDEDETLSKSETFSNLPVDTYLISEDQIEGWDLDEITCRGTDNFSVDLDQMSVEIDLESEDDVTCVFINKEIEDGPRCGDGIINGNEQCDYGEANGDGYCSQECSFVSACIPEENLVFNGGFENVEVTHAKKWNIFNETIPLLGWFIDWYGGSPSYNNNQRPELANLELHAGVNGWLPASGSQYAELDSDWDGPDGSLNNEPASTSIFQYLPTLENHKYKIEFKFSPRPSTGTGDNEVELSWGGSVVDTYSASGGSNTSWQTISEEMVADSSLTELMFTDLGNSNSLGTFIDEISVTCEGPVTGTIGGMKYNDIDGDGEKDDNEPGLAGWTITRTQEEGPVLETTTGEDGTYSFENVPFGEYELCEINQSGWVNTDPEDGLCKDVTLDSEYEEVNFGNTKEGTYILGYKVVCDSEEYLPNWGTQRRTINENTAQGWVDGSEGHCRLVDDWNFQWSPAGGGSSGDFQTQTDLLGGSWNTFVSGIKTKITDLSKLGGRIEVREVFPEDSSLVGFSNNSGDNNSAEIYCTGDAFNYDNWEWISNPKVDATYHCVAFNAYEYGSIYGVKFMDFNYNGVLDTGEETLSGWTIFIDADGDGILDGDEISTTTDEEGKYRFENLISGEYTIEEVQQEGWAKTTPSGEENVIVLEAGKEEELNFGNYQIATVQICKYDHNEKPLEGWKVVLRGFEPIGSVNVKPDGNTYSSEVLGLGNYVLRGLGTYVYRPGNPEADVSDTNYSKRLPTDAVYGGPYVPWVNVNTFPPAVKGFLGIMVNGVATDWGYYSDDHEYYLGFPGYSGDFDFSIKDDNYRDNSGSLDVEIYEGYAGITGENGCTTFEGVPFGDYYLDEALESGWKNIDGLGETVVDESEEKFSIFNQIDEPATIHATKIVCDSEEDLPNWGTGGPAITASTAAAWLETHESCRLEEGWQFQWGYSNAPNPGDNTGESLDTRWFTTDPTDVNGVVTVEVEDLKDSAHLWFREVWNDEYIPFTFGANNNTNVDNVSAELYCHTDVLNYDNWDRIDGVEYGEDYYCVAWNVENSGSISGDKFNDEDNEGDWDEGEQVLGDWEIQLFDEQYQLIDTTTTGEEGYTFENVKSGKYFVCEVNQDFWTQTYPTGEDYVNQLEKACHEVIVNPGDNLTGVDFGNYQNPPTINISKSNDAEGSLFAGGFVGFTITIEILDNPAFNVILTDLLPEGFVYRGGSWGAQSNLNPEYSIPEPVYQSPGVWSLGDLEVGEIITLTYIADISEDVDQGTYKDLAWAVGGPHETLALATEEGYVSENFVGTQVEIADGERRIGGPKVEIDEETIIEGEVLGASTSLPATGASSIWLISLLALLGVGLSMIFAGIVLNKGKKSLIRTLFIGISFAALMLATNGKAHAASLSVRIEEPKDMTRSPFNLTFVALDNMDREIEAKCLVKKPGEATFSQFDTTKFLQAGGDTDVCAVSSSVLTTQGDYAFKVEVRAGEEFDSDGPVTVTYDNEGPEEPDYLEKKKSGDCKFELDFKTGDDGNTSYVEIYRGGDREFTADNEAKIKTINIGPDTTYEYDDELYGNECGKTYYYAIRAFDSFGNGSDIVAEEDVVIVRKVDLGTEDDGTTVLLAQAGNVGEGGTDGEVEILLDSEEGSVLGEEDQQDGTEDNSQASGDETEDEDSTPTWVWVLLALSGGFIAFRASKKFLG